MVIIKFLKPTGPYTRGDSAGFPSEEARRYVDLGYAVMDPAPGEDFQPEPASQTVEVSQPAEPGQAVASHPRKVRAKRGEQ